MRFCFPTIQLFGCLLVLIPVCRGQFDTQPKLIAEKPLEARSGPRGKTLFTTLSPEETGITAINHYDDPKMWAEFFQEFTTGAIGTGVAIGDYDNDGRPDVFVVCKTGENHLYRNLGNFKFEDVTTRAGVGGPTDAWKQGAVFVDINNDGKLDLYVCRFGAPNLLYINQGDGTFKEEAAQRGLAVSDASANASFMDYDRDGFLDVFIQTNLLDAEAHPTGQRNYLFHNNGDGTFTDVTDKAQISTLRAQGHSATWWDYNEDGWPDLYVANDFTEPDVLYRNNGDGTFTNVIDTTVPHLPQSSMGADVGDLLNNGHINLLVAEMAASSRYKDQRSVAPMRAALQEPDPKTAAPPQYMRNALFLNTGAGRMLEGAFLAGLDATDWTWSVRFEDLDNDGRLDAFFTNGMVREFHAADLLKKMLPMESVSERNRLMGASALLKEKNFAFQNRGDLRFENVSESWGLDHLGVSFGAAFGDLDGDGDLDLVFANYNGQFTVCRNDSDTGHRVIFELHGTVSNRFGIGALIKLETSEGTQVRPLLISRGYLSSSEPIGHFGLGAVTSIKRVTITWPSGNIQTFENLLGDRRYLITEPNVRPKLSAPGPETVSHGQFKDVTTDLNLGALSSQRAFDELALQPLLSMRLNGQGPAAAVVDIDNAGIENLYMGSTLGASGRLFANSGDGHFLPYGTETFSDPSQADDAGLLFFDVDGDGYDDVITTKGGDAQPAGSILYQPRLLLNDRHGHFTPAKEGSLPSWPISASAVVAADFNHDGKLDVFIGGRATPGHYPSIPGSALWVNEGGRFVDMTEQIAPGIRHVGMVTAAIWSDVDGDGWVDLVLTLDWGSVKYFHNEAGRAFTDQSDKFGFTAGGTGWWRSIASADFNGDGKPDFVVGNVGLNTRYRTSRGHPAVLFSNLLNTSGRGQLVEAQYDGDQLYPLRALPQMSAAFPELRKKFPTYESYARATLNQVFTADTLAAATRLEVTEFQSGVFMSQPDGTYRFQPLPRIAQIAPIFGLVAGDFDGDGHADICLVQNSYAPIEETTRFDGGVGLLLHGDGVGNFTPVSTAESGLMITGDAKALVTVDLDQDGWPDLFATRNNGMSIAFRNQGQAGHRSFAIVLRGKHGNPHAIGARVTVMLKDGSLQTAEVTAGSGYLSQSTPALFFGYRENNLPQTITVRWPDARVTKESWKKFSPKIVLTAPLP